MNRPSLVLALLLGLVAVEPAFAALERSAQIREVVGYCARIDRYVKAHETAFLEFRRGPGPRNDGAGTWRRWPKARADERVESNGDARVWRRNGRTVFVTFLIQSGSGDWALYASYYYRPDGTLAKLESELRTFIGDVAVQRDWVYSVNGSVLDFRARYRTLSGEPTRLNGGFLDVSVPLYPAVADLPFGRLLRR